MAWVNGLMAAFGLSASAGLNAYIPLLVVGLLARYTPWVRLNPPWDALAHGGVLAGLAVLAAVEFLADKVPAVNHLNDALQTFVRPVAGAIVFAASTQAIAVPPALALLAGLIVAGSVHATKAAVVRPAVTASTAGAANPIVSFLEDVLALVTSLVALLIPALMAALAIVVLMAWLSRRRPRATGPRGAG